MKKTKPSMFALSKQDIVISFFGAFLLGLVFMIQGYLAKVAQSLSVVKILLVILVTFAVLSFKVYVNSYRKLKMKHDILFYEILTARLILYYAVTLIVSLYLLYSFFPYLGITSIQSFFKVLILTTLPCSFGAMIPILFKRF